MADEPTRSINEQIPTTETRVVNVDTSFISSGRTRIVNQDGRRMALGILSKGTNLLGQYTVAETLRAHETLRPGVYLCDAKDQQVIVKIHGLDCPPDRELWKRIGSLEHPNVVRTLKQIEHDGLFYEILSYCSVGALKVSHRMTEQEVTSSLLPQITAALHYLHEQGVVHRDIKPSNIFVHEQNGQQHYLLGDFDISSQISSDYTQRVTARAAGTWTYTAPEAFPRFQDEDGKVGAKVHRNSDYYSFGVTLYELLVGTTPLHHSKLPDLFDFYLTGERVIAPESVSARMRSLLQGLLIRDYHRRWGYDECQRWLVNANTAEDMASIEEDNNRNPFNTVQMEPYQFGDTKVTTPKQLAQAMVRNQGLAKEHMEHNDWLFSWLGRADSNLTVKVRKEFRENITDPDIVTWCCCILDPSTPLHIDGTYVSSMIEWIQYIELQLHQIEFISESQRLIKWLRYRNEEDHQLAAAVNAISSDNSPSMDISFKLFLIRCIKQPSLPLVIGDVPVHSAIQWIDQVEKNWYSGVHLTKNDIDHFIRWLSIRSEEDQQLAEITRYVFEQYGLNEEIPIALTVLRIRYNPDSPITYHSKTCHTAEEWLQAVNTDNPINSKLDPIEVTKLVEWLKYRDHASIHLSSVIEQLPDNQQYSPVFLQCVITPKAPYCYKGITASDLTEWTYIAEMHILQGKQITEEHIELLQFWLRMRNDDASSELQRTNSIVRKSQTDQLQFWAALRHNVNPNGPLRIQGTTINYVTQWPSAMTERYGNLRSISELEYIHLTTWLNERSVSDSRILDEIKKLPTELKRDYDLLCTIIDPLSPLHICDHPVYSPEEWIEMCNQQWKKEGSIPRYELSRFTAWVNLISVGDVKVIKAILMIPSEYICDLDFINLAMNPDVPLNVQGRPVYSPVEWVNVCMSLYTNVMEIPKQVVARYIAWLQLNGDKHQIILNNIVRIPEKWRCDFDFVCYHITLKAPLHIHDHPVYTSAEFVSACEQLWGNERIIPKQVLERFTSWLMLHGSPYSDWLEIIGAIPEKYRNDIDFIHYKIDPLSPIIVNGHSIFLPKEWVDWCNERYFDKRKIPSDELDRFISWLKLHGDKFRHFINCVNNIPLMFQNDLDFISIIVDQNAPYFIFGTPVYNMKEWYNVYYNEPAKYICDGTSIYRYSFNDTEIYRYRYWLRLHTQPYSNDVIAFLKITSSKNIDQNDLRCLVEFGSAFYKRQSTTRLRRDNDVQIRSYIHGHIDKPKRQKPALKTKKFDVDSFGIKMSILGIISAVFGVTPTTRILAMCMMLIGIIIGIKYITNGVTCCSCSSVFGLLGLLTVAMYMWPLDVESSNQLLITCTVLITSIILFFYKD